MLVAIGRVRKVKQLVELGWPASEKEAEMGYYTDYEMVPNRDRFETYQPIEAFIEGTKVDGWSYLFDVWCGEGVGLTWYDHDADMSRLSLAFPTILFTLWGHGEEADDLWKKYYLNGKCQLARAVITYPYCEFTSICPACNGAGVLDADGYPSIGCPRCWGEGGILE